MPFLIPILTDGFMTKILIESNNCHEIAHKHFYPPRTCIVNGISLHTQTTYFPHKNPEMTINISIYIWHLRVFGGLFTVKRKGLDDPDIPTFLRQKVSRCRENQLRHFGAFPRLLLV